MGQLAGHVCFCCCLLGSPLDSLFASVEQLVVTVSALTSLRNGIGGFCFGVGVEILQVQSCLVLQA